MSTLFKSSILIVICSIGMISCTELSQITLGDVSDVLITDEPLSLTNDEVIAGLKEALNKGTEKAVNLASKEDGFYKNDLLYIAFPEDAIKVKEKALEFGLDGQVEKFEMTLNRAAEEASKKAIPIFLDAITGMTIQDGFNILNGNDDAATEYLRSSTRASLVNEFSPVVQTAIETVQLTKHWEPLINKYNSVIVFTGGEQVNPDLNAYITDKAIDGLFIHIESEEKNIRANPQARVTELLQKVFGSIN